MSNLNTQYKAFVASLFNRTGDLSKDFSHAVMGIVTETRELWKATDNTNALEEAGDLEFFGEALTLVANEFLRGIDQVKYESALDHVHQLLCTGQPLNEVMADLNNDLLDVAKRWVGYGKEPVDMYAVLAKADVIATVALNVALIEFPKSKVEDESERRLSNMRKLLKRYPEGKFDAFKAVVRDLEAERAAVAGA